MALLIAPTLLDSYDWFKKSPASWKERAYDGLRASLAREFTETPETKAGNDFESYVYANANVPDLEAMNTSDNFKKVCRRVRGMNYQQNVKRFVKINGMEYILFCRIDALAPNDIVDIKTTSNYRGATSYLSKWQHRMYPYCTGIPNFTYLVSEWEQGSLTKIKEVHEIDYVVDSFDLIGQEITQQITDFISFIESDSEMERLYYTVYNKYDHGNYYKKKV